MWLLNIQSYTFKDVFDNFLSTITTIQFVFATISFGILIEYNLKAFLEFC